MAMVQKRDKISPHSFCFFCLYFYFLYILAIFGLKRANQHWKNRIKPLYLAYIRLKLMLMPIATKFKTQTTCRASWQRQIVALLLKNSKAPAKNDRDCSLKNDCYEKLLSLALLRCKDTMSFLILQPCVSYFFNLILYGFSRLLLRFL